MSGVGKIPVILVLNSFIYQKGNPMRHIEARFRSLYFAMLVNFIIFGITLTIIGATLPKLIRDFQWSYIETGFVISAGSIGYFVSTFISGILVHKLNPKQVVVGGLMIQTLGLSMFALRPNVILNLLLNLLIGLGQGGTEVVINYSVVRIERSGESRLMNLMHAAFAVGAIIGPIIVGTLINAGSSWQTIYRLMALVSIMMAGAFSFLPFSRLRDDSGESRDEPGLFEMLKHPLLILSFLILFLYVGTELGVSSWVAEYYVKFLKTSASTGAFMVSIFWIGLLMGRLGLSGYKGSRQSELILILSSICTLSLTFAILMNSPWLAGVGFFMSGLGYSAIYPLVISLLGKHLKRGQGVAIGFAATGGGVGLFLSPFFMAAISDRFGIQRGFFFYIALDVVMLLLSCAVLWHTRALYRRQE
jgi:fucose permease